MVQQVWKRSKCLRELEKSSMKLLHLLGVLFNSKGLLYSTAWGSTPKDVSHFKLGWF